MQSLDAGRQLRHLRAECGVVVVRRDPGLGLLLAGHSVEVLAGGFEERGVGCDEGGEDEKGVGFGVGVGRVRWWWWLGGVGRGCQW